MHLFVFLKKRGTNRITVTNHLVGSVNKMFQPFRVANVSNSLKVRTNLVAVPNGVACGALSGKKIAALVNINFLGLGCARALFFPGKLPVVKSVADQVARNRGLSVAAFRIHWPPGSLPISTAAMCPSRSLGSGS
jgi:hypothetical protein